MKLRAICLWQPWATAIELELKPYETRHWATDYRGPIVICSAKKPFRHQDYEPQFYQEVCRRLSKAGCPHYALRYGKAHCIATLTDCIPTEQIRGRISQNHAFWGDFTPGRYAFKLENIQRLPVEIDVVGRQKFFSVEIPDKYLGPYYASQFEQGLFPVTA